jgi:hypothetical protein
MPTPGAGRIPPAKRRPPSLPKATVARSKRPRRRTGASCTRLSVRPANPKLTASKDPKHYWNDLSRSGGMPKSLSRMGSFRNDPALACRSALRRMRRFSNPPALYVGAGHDVRKPTGTPHG